MCMCVRMRMRMRMTASGMHRDHCFLGTKLSFAAEAAVEPLAVDSSKNTVFVFI